MHRSGKRTICKEPFFLAATDTALVRTYVRGGLHPGVRARMRACMRACTCACMRAVDIVIIGNVGFIFI